MIDESRIRELLEEALDSELTPEEVCADDPELLPELRRRWEKVQHVNEAIDGLFPSSVPTRSRPPTGARPSADKLIELEEYEVESVLGRGGMGVVYLARHLKLNRTVAIKMLLVGTYAGPEERSRFLREAQAIARLKHPNIVQIYDVGELDGLPYYSMEFVEGGTLAEKLAGAPLPIRESVAMLITLADAVHAAHQSGIVHRDLKPANILLSVDGTPKITDFGLAREIEGEVTLTRVGVHLGTPSYMSPEQAAGRTEAVGPGTDIYSLGAVLFELLTGRPPFRAESALETERQVLTQEPVPPSRLNGKVSRDLETICLKCLEKDPRNRYESASALAEDLSRFVKGEPIQARPLSRIGRAVRWVQRNPTITALLSTAALFLGFALVTVLREREMGIKQRAELAKWSDQLAFVISLQEEGRFAEARAVLLKTDPDDSDLRDRIAAACANLTLAEKLDAIRLNRAGNSQGSGINYPEASRRYEAAFRDGGLGEFTNDPHLVAERLNASPIRKALISALDDWAACAEKKHREWILRVVKRMDPDPWRDQIRDADGWSKTERFPSLATAADISNQPVTIMVAFGTRWRRLGGDPTAFLQGVQRRYPNDLWVNFELGHLLQPRDPTAALGYYRAALAIRPDAAIVHFKLGTCHAGLSQPAVAMEHFRRAAQLDPTNKEAGICYASALADAGRLDEAIDRWRQVLTIDPHLTVVRQSIRGTMIKQGRAKEVATEWRRHLDVNGKAHEEWDGYAEFSLFMGDIVEYRRACQEVLARFGTSADPHVCERIGRACLLAPASEEVVRRGTELIDRALAADKSTYAAWAPPYFFFAKGLGEYRQHRFDQAVEIQQTKASGVLGPAPKLVLAMAHYRRGDPKKAHQVYEEAVSSFDWKEDEAVFSEMWIYHSLRREAQVLLTSTPNQTNPRR